MEASSKIEKAVARAVIWNVTDNEVNQRIDNFLIKQLKGVPKSRIQRAIRKGEVRVNGSRIKSHYHLKKDDKVRIPPIRVSNGDKPEFIPDSVIKSISVLYEDEDMLVVDKPSGLAVHGGSGLDYGLIEVFKKIDPPRSFIELVHRLDRETSGCLMLAKNRSTLLALQQQLGEERSLKKTYIALVKGQWKGGKKTINAPLLVSKQDGQHKKTHVDESGQASTSIINSKSVFKDSSLVEVQLLTGRMHQARAHCSHLDFPIAGDWLYGNNNFNREVKKAGLKRLFLHASKIVISHPSTKQILEIRAPLPDQLKQFLQTREPD